LADGQVLELEALRPPLRPPFLRHGWLYQSVFLVCILALAAWAAHTSLAPVVHLGKAAEQLAEDGFHPALTEVGTREVRAAIRAANLMRERMKSWFSERNELLGSITHDLQTPLTRMRLRLEGLEAGETRERLLKDVATMQHLIAHRLDLARSSHSQEAVEPLDLSSFLENLCEDFSEIELLPVPSSVVRARPGELRRCLENLLDNARRYGGKATVSVRVENSRVEILIEDQGPGIADSDLPKLFLPFARGESGGTGLGLAIAQNLAKLQGAQLRLENRAEGGLRARLLLSCQC